MTAILECNNCTFAYDSSRTVLSDVSFALHRGEFVSLLGPNGAGKSTLMKLILNRITPLQGTITVEGTSVRSMSDRMIASQIGYVEQSTPLTAMSVRDFVLLGTIAQFSRHRFWFSREEKSRACELLADFGISHLESHSLDQISGGEQQLVQICRALMVSPNLLLLDEPVSHLDIQHIDTVIQLLLKIKKERNVTILTSIHDLYLATACSDRMLLLDTNGTLSCETNPVHPDTNLLKKVFNATFEQAFLGENNEKVIIPRYRFR